MKSLRQRYVAALIDEFQDTDPLQYAIFQSLFAGESSAAGETAMLLIGDPKQAIYSFRGADVFAYMQAAQEVGERFTLDKNWRSTEALVKGGTVSSRMCAFVFPEIEFRGAGRPKNSGGYLGRASRSRAALGDADGPDSTSTKTERMKNCPQPRRRDCAMASRRDQW